jgi:hypothetical protein
MGLAGGRGSRSGNSNKASNAALDDDEDLMNRRRVNFEKWKGARKKKRESHPSHLIDYVNSPSPGKRT